MVWLPDGEKKLFEDMFIRFDGMNKRDGHTHTPHHGTGRACVASHGKNRDFRPISRFIFKSIQSFKAS